MCQSQIESPYKKSIFGGKGFNEKLEYYRNTNEFFIIAEHNNICDQKNKKIYCNNAQIKKEFIKFSNFKSDLIKYLNLHPLTF